MVSSWRGGFCVYFQVHGAGKRSLLRILHSPKGGASMLELLIIRGIFILVLTISAYALHPFHSSPWPPAAAVWGLWVPSSCRWSSPRPRPSLSCNCVSCG